MEDKLHLQAGFAGWIPDFAAPSGMFVPTLTCGAYNPVNSQNGTPSSATRPSTARSRAPGRYRQSDPEAASRLWAKTDRDVVNQAPWVPIANGLELEVTSARVHNYQYNPQLGTLLDQIWVR